MKFWWSMAGIGALVAIAGFVPADTQKPAVAPIGPFARAESGFCDGLFYGPMKVILGEIRDIDEVRDERAEAPQDRCTTTSRAAPASPSP